jgi:hypothetical protein
VAKGVKRSAMRVSGGGELSMQRDWEVVDDGGSGGGFRSKSWSWVLKVKLFLVVVCWWEIGCRRFRERASESEVTSIIWRPRKPVRDNSLFG